MTTNNCVENEATETVLPALVIEGGFSYDDCKSGAVIATARGGVVSLTSNRSPNIEVSLYVSEWRRLVEFVESQLAPAAPKVDESWKPDWSKIDTGWTHYAVDPNGDGVVYDAKPVLGRNLWWCGDGGGDFKKISKVKLPDSLDWTQTLCVRPGV